MPDRSIHSCGLPRQREQVFPVLQRSGSATKGPSAASSFTSRTHAHASHIEIEGKMWHFAYCRRRSISLQAGVCPASCEYARRGVQFANIKFWTISSRLQMARP